MYEEKQLYHWHVNVKTHGVEQSFVFKQDFFHSKEYLQLQKMGEQLQQLFGADSHVRYGDLVHPVGEFKDMVDWLMLQAKQGIVIQRYKGLGEMNPEQLWETTMDPTIRRMLRVTVEDAIHADQLFTTLMGDQVEPRREFIEQNALEVDNLDV